MSVTVVIQSKNGADNIRRSRQSTNESNWAEDTKIWSVISNILVGDSNLSKSINKKGEIKFSYKKSNGYKKNGASKKLVIDKELSSVITTLAKKIANNNALEYNITYEDEVEFWMILDMLQTLMNIPKKCQKFFCRNASRQSVDEQVQIEMIKHYCPKVKIEKPTNGSHTLYSGKLLDKDQLSKQTGAKKAARSIDSIITFTSDKENVEYKAYGFLKYSGPVGSVTSELQTRETEMFIEQSKLYCSKNPNSKDKFFVQIDGGAGEDHISEFKKLIPSVYSDRIIVGNSEQIIDWANSLTK
jgi:hypothetical protein